MVHRPQSGESGLSQFSVRLLSDTFEALMASAAEQSERLADLDAMLAMPEEAFRRTHITAEMIDDELLALFGPGKRADRVSAVDAAEPYQPARRTVAEAPAVEHATGVVLADGDVAKVDGGYRFTARGAGRVRDAVAAALTGRARERLAAVRRHGVSRVEVERGKINVKLVMKLETRPAGEGETAAPALGIRVAPVSLSDPAILRSKTNLSAELEIHFRTLRNEE